MYHSSSPLRPAIFPVLLAILSMTLTGCGQPLDEDQLVDITWVPWSREDPALATLDRAALMIPVLIDGKEALMQLDTGASRTTLYRPLADRLGIRYEVGEKVEWNQLPGAYRARIPKITVGGVPRKGMDVIIWGLPSENTGTSDRTAEQDPRSGRLVKLGDLGTDFFREPRPAALYIDFVSSKLGVFQRAPRVSGRVIPFKIVSGRPVITLSGSCTLHALYDTGSSPLGLMVTLDIFRTLTGLDPNSEQVSVLVAPSWGRTIDLHGTPTDLTFRAGRHEFAFPVLWCSPMMDQLARSTRGQIDAILGNEAFRSSRILLDFRRNVLIVIEDGRR